jgi:hypothetical protein
MSPPPIDTTRCAPNTNAITVIAASRATFGLVTNAAVSPPDATSAPRLSTCRPGSISGREEMRAESLRYAPTDPVNVTAPMNTPIETSA